MCNSEISISLLVGGFNPSERYQSIKMIIPNIWKIKNVPNHQPALICVLKMFESLKYLQVFSKPGYLHRNMSNHQVIAWVEPIHYIGLLKKDMALEGDSGVKLGLQQYGHWMIHQSCHLG